MSSSTNPPYKAELNLQLRERHTLSTHTERFNEQDHLWRIRFHFRLLKMAAKSAPGTMEEVVSRRLSERFEITGDIAAGMAFVILWDLPGGPGAWDNANLKEIARLLESPAAEMHPYLEKAAEVIGLSKVADQAMRKVNVSQWTSPEEVARELKRQLTELVGPDSCVLTVEAHPASMDMDDDDPYELSRWLSPTD